MCKVKNLEERICKIESWLGPEDDGNARKDTAGSSSQHRSQRNSPRVHPHGSERSQGREEDLDYDEIEDIIEKCMQEF